DQPRLPRRGLGPRGLDLRTGSLELPGGPARRGFRLVDPAGELGLVLRELILVGLLDLRELALELDPRRADLLLELRLALDEIGAMGSAHALDLRLGGPELVLQHRGTLLFVAKRSKLRARVVELAPCRRELG